VPTKIEGLPESGEEGVDYPLTITGDLTIKEVTKEVTFEAVIRLEGDTLTGTATTTILMSDFGVGPISILGILNTEDEVVLTLDFIAKADSPSQ
jgi:polyisoprenoid-binding protein YceI